MARKGRTPVEHFLLILGQIVAITGCACFVVAFVGLAVFALIWRYSESGVMWGLAWSSTLLYVFLLRRKLRRRRAPFDNFMCVSALKLTKQERERIREVLDMAEARDTKP